MDIIGFIRYTAAMSSLVELVDRDARLPGMMACRVLHLKRPLTGGEALCLRHLGAHGGLWSCQDR